MLQVAHERRTVIGYAVLFLGAFALCLPRLYPGAAVDDSPETVAVALGLGLGHPPGYPLHSLLGRLALLCFPGGAALRLSILGSIYAALSAVVAGSLALRLSAWRFSAMIGAAAAVAMLPELLEAAAAPKGSVFTLNLLLSLLVIHRLFADRARQAFLLLGLALAHHYASQIPFLPLYAWLYARIPGRRRSDLYGLLPGLSLWLYVPLRAWQQPLPNWRYIHDWLGVLRYVARADYIQGHAPLSLRALYDGLAASLRCLRILPLGLLLLALPGSLGLVRRGQGLLLVLGLCLPLFLISAYAMVEQNNLYMLALALLPIQAFLALLAGLGVESLGLGRKPAWLALLLLLFNLSLPLKALGWSASFEQEDYCFNMAALCPRQAVLLSNEDPEFLGLWYLQSRGRRRDLTVIGCGPSWLSQARFDLGRNHPELRLDEELSFVPTLQSILRQGQGRLLLLGARRMALPGFEAFDQLPFGMGRILLPHRQARRLRGGGAVLWARYSALSFRSPPPLSRDAYARSAIFEALASECDELMTLSLAAGQPAAAAKWAGLARYFR